MRKKNKPTTEKSGKSIRVSKAISKGEIARSLEGLSSLLYADADAADAINDFICAHEVNIYDVVADYIIDNWGKKPSKK